VKTWPQTNGYVLHIIYSGIHIVDRAWGEWQHQRTPSDPSMQVRSCTTDWTSLPSRSGLKLNVLKPRKTGHGTCQPITSLMAVSQLITSSFREHLQGGRLSPDASCVRRVASVSSPLLWLRTGDCITCSVTCSVTCSQQPPRTLAVQAFPRTLRLP
jgi:hypothetical protein